MQTFVSRNTPSTLLLLLALCTVIVSAQNQPPAAGPGERRVIMGGPPPGGGPGGPGGPGQRIIIGGPGGPPEISPEAKGMPQPKNDAELAASIKQLADKLAADGRFSGSIYLAKDGEPLVNSAWGFADQNRGTANTPDTAYDIASIGKLFTQAAVLQLAEQGKLALDDPFGKFLKDYPNRAIADKVTLRQLLLHTSGMGDIFERITPDTNLAGMTELKDFLPLFVQKPLLFEPGTGNEYSNAGYIVLGMVIEAVSGENYYDYVRRHILEPAGMVHSGFFDRRHLSPNVARSYMENNDMTAMHPGRGSPAGGLQASAGDLGRLVQALNSGKLLQPESVTRLNTLVPRPPGVPTQFPPGRLIAYGIEGGAPGLSAQLVADPTGHYTRVVLCNGEPPMAMSMAFTIREWLRQMPR
jgi:CubicO group peptidase (beta-lactamase class C family)